MIFLIPFLLGLGISIVLYVLFVIYLSISNFGFAGIVFILFPIYIFIIPLIIGTLIGLIRAVRNGQWTGNKVVICIFGGLVLILCCLFIVSSIQYPNKIISKTNSAVRKQNVYLLSKAVLLFYEKNQDLPPQITTEPQRIAKTGADLCQELISKYIGSLPRDSQIENGGYINDCNSNYDTGYAIYKNATGDAFTISAIFSEGEQIATTTALPR